MKRNQTTLTCRPLATLVLIVAGALVTTACSSSQANVSSDAPEAIALDASRIEEHDSSGLETVSDPAVSVSPSTSPSTSQPPVTTTTVLSSTTSVLATTTSAAVSHTPVLPEDLTGVTAAPATGLTVSTAPGDPLNVRTGPGVSYPVLGQFVDGTTGVDATYRYVLESGAVWRFVQGSGGMTGWVNSAYLRGVSPTASCTKGANFPEFEGAVAVGNGDVDLDGLVDEVFVLAEPQPEFGYHAWLLVSFGNGGVATGEWADFFEPSPVAGIHIFNLTTLAGPNDPNEIIFSTGQGASHGQWGVAALSGCTIVPTTLDGVPFGFSHGASAGHSTVAGCAYGPHGEVEFVITSQNFNTGEWTQSSYQLDDLEWLFLGASDETDFPAPFQPSPLVLTDCVGLVVGS